MKNFPPSASVDPPSPIRVPDPQLQALLASLLPSMTCSDKVQRLQEKMHAVKGCGGRNEASSEVNFFNLASQACLPAAFTK